MTKCVKVNRNLFRLVQTQFLTSKWTLFLNTEAGFPYCDWSIIKSISGFVQTSGDVYRAGRQHVHRTEMGVCIK